MAALLEILYLTVPDAYLNDDASTVGATGATGGTGEVGRGDGVPGGELRTPVQATVNPERRYQHFLRYGIFMYSRLTPVGKNKQPPATSLEVVILVEQPVYKPGPVGLRE